MANPTSYADLFDFKDSTKIDEAIAKIEKISAGLEVLASHAEKASQKYSESLGNIAKSATNLEKKITELNATEKDQQEAIVKGAAEAEKLLKTQESVSKSYKSERDALAMLTEAQNKLKASKETLNKSTILEAGSIAQIKKQLREAVSLYESYGEATSNAVKEETLTKIKALSKSLAEGESALKAAKKGAELAAGSYNSLSLEVSEAKKKLKDMEGGIGSTSQEFKDLQKFIVEGSDKLKDFDKAVGDNQRNVGNYPTQFAASIPIIGGIVSKSIEAGEGFGGVAKGIKSATKEALLFIATPIGAVLALIAGAVGLLTSYFRRSTEGQDDLNKVLAVASALFDGLLAIIEPLGKALFKAITEPKKLFNDLAIILKPLTDQIKAVFEDPIGSIKKLGKIIYDNVISRFEAIGVAGKGIVQILNGKFAAGFKSLANASIQAATGIKDGVDKIKDAATATAEYLANLARIAAENAKKAYELGVKIANAEAKIRKDKIEDIINDSEVELSVTQKLVNSKNKLKFTDEQRYNFLRTANQELSDQLTGDLALTQEQIDLVDLQIQQEGETYELLEKRAALTAEFNNQQTAFFNARKNRQKAEIALIQEIDKETQAQIKREADADRALETFRVQGRIAANAEIIASDNAASDEIVNAILDTAKQEQELAELSKVAALDIAKEEAIGRISLSDDALEEIYNNETISINERIAQERAAKELLLEDDKTFVTTRLRINEQFLSGIEDSNKKAADAVNKNIFTQLEKDFNHLDETITTGSNDQATAISEAYTDGNISASRLMRERLKNQEQAQRDSLIAQINYLEKYKDQLKALGNDTTKIDTEISAARRAIAETDADARVEAEKKVKDAVISLSQEALAGASEIMAGRTQAAIDNLNQQLQAESDKKDRSIQIVGDDAQAKAFIEEAFAQKQKDIQRKIIQEKRKQAVFDKATAITQAAINTALGITNALGSSVPPLSFILAALTGAAGAIQIAAIASKPIPQFYTGTSDSPEGYAWVGDRGPELVREPGKKPYVADRPQIRYLKRHSVVHNAAETDSLLSTGNMFGDGYGMSGQLKQSFDGVRIAALSSFNSLAVASAVDRSTTQIVDAIRSAPQDYYDEHGYRRYEISEGLRIARLDKRYKL